MQSPRDFASGLGKGRIVDAIDPPFFEKQSGLGLLQCAKRQDARQQHSWPIYRASKLIGKCAGRAPRRDIDRGAGYLQRAKAGRESLDDTPLEERGHEGFQKWRTRRDGENAFLQANFWNDSCDRWGSSCRLFILHPISFRALSHARWPPGRTAGSLGTLVLRALHCGDKLVHCSQIQWG